MSAPASELRGEVVELARALIRIDTSNPPGNETAAAELLGAYLRDAGVDEVELVGPDPSGSTWWRGSRARARVRR